MADKTTIAIVDDDASIREAMKGLIRSFGYSVTTFSSSEEYLASELHIETSCVITDVQMPGMTGIDLQRRLIETGRRTPIIFMTAYPDANARETAMDAGAFGFLAKPFDDTHLIECLDRALAGGPRNNP